MTTTKRKPRARRKPKGPIYGHEAPRVFTPPRRKLTPATSAGFAAIVFAEYLRAELLGTRYEELVPELLPYQRWLLIHALELNPDNSYRFKIVLIWIARQNGKTFILALLILFRMFVDGDAQVLGVAQKLATAKKPWEHARKIIDAIPELSDQVSDQSNTNGELWFEIDDGPKYWVDSADNGGRGLTFDLVFVDEILKHKNYKAWSALSKTTNARRRAQLYAASNTGDLDSVVQRDQHDKAMIPIAEGDSSTTTGLFWWSPPAGADLSDPETWAWGNPAMGYLITEDALRSSWGSDPRAVFESEVANLFTSDATGGPFQPGKWAECRDPIGRRAPDAPLYLCIEVSHDGTWAHIGFAARREDSRAHVGIMALAPGTDWVARWLTDPKRTFTPAAITLQTRGAPVSALRTELEEAGLEITDWGGPDLGIATILLLDAVNFGKLTHRDQPALDVAAGTAVTKALGDTHVIDRKNSPGDASPLSAVAGAHWLLKNPPVEVEARIRVLGRGSHG